MTKQHNRKTVRLRWAIWRNSSLASQSEPTSAAYLYHELRRHENAGSVLPKYPRDDSIIYPA